MITIRLIIICPIGAVEQITELIFPPGLEFNGCGKTAFAFLHGRRLFLPGIKVAYDIGFIGVISRQ